MKTKYKYIKFVESVGGMWTCQNRQGKKNRIGLVRWHSTEKTYVFLAESANIDFSPDCLDDVAAFMRQLNKQRKAKI